MKKLIFVLIFAILVYELAKNERESPYVSLEFKNFSPKWKKEVLFSLLKEKSLKNNCSFLKETPWVKSCKEKGNTFILTATPPLFAIIWRDKRFLIGENFFVLSESNEFPSLPEYFYGGKDSPFFKKGRNLKLKKILSFQVSLLKNRLSLQNLKEVPKIVIGEVGIGLIFPKSGVIVMLDSTVKSWKTFYGFLSKFKKIPPGIYDFRFSDLLVRRTKNV